MIIYYRGHGAFVALIVVGFIFLAILAVALLAPDLGLRAWVIGLAVLLAGMVLYPLGRRLNRPLDETEQALANDPQFSPLLASRLDKRHSLYGIRMEHWGIAAAVVGSLVCVISLLSGDAVAPRTNQQAKSTDNPESKPHIPRKIIVPPLPDLTKELPIPEVPETVQPKKLSPEQASDELRLLGVTYNQFTIRTPFIAAPKRAASFMTTLKSAAPNIHKQIQNGTYTINSHVLAKKKGATVLAYKTEPEESGDFLTVTNYGKVMTMTPEELKLGLGADE